MRACIVAQSPDEFISGMIGFKEYHHKWAFSVRRAVMISGEDRVLQGIPWSGRLCLNASRGFEPMNLANLSIAIPKT
jgi:hypothetical protein